MELKTKTSQDNTHHINNIVSVELRALGTVTAHTENDVNDIEKQKIALIDGAIIMGVASIVRKILKISLGLPNKVVDTEFLTRIKKYSHKIAEIIDQDPQFKIARYAAENTIPEYFRQLNIDDIKEKISLSSRIRKKFSSILEKIKLRKPQVY
jgi:hypothetical protein